MGTITRVSCAVFPSESTAWVNSRGENVGNFGLVSTFIDTYLRVGHQSAHDDQEMGKQRGIAAPGGHPRQGGSCGEQPGGNPIYRGETGGVRSAGPGVHPSGTLGRGRLNTQRKARQGQASAADQSAQCPDGATSSAGLQSKKPTGISVKPVYSTGITGQSSGRGTWVTPNVCHTTMSVFSVFRFCSV